jgi:excisionase family DNA binding protein
MGSNANPVPQRGMTVSQAATFLGTNGKQVRRLIHRRELPAIRLGKAYVIDRQDLLSWWQKAKRV